MGLRLPGGFKEDYFVTQIDTKKVSALLWTCNSPVKMADAQLQRRIYSVISRSLLELHECPV